MISPTPYWTFWVKYSVFVNPKQTTQNTTRSNQYATNAVSPALVTIEVVLSVTIHTGLLKILCVPALEGLRKQMESARVLILITIQELKVLARV